MKVKNFLISKYIKYVLIPKIIIIDVSGYIFEDFKKIGLNAVSREIFIPESLIAMLEIHFSKNVLYSLGKKFGYTYASVSNLPKIEKVSRKEFEKYASFQIMYTEGTYAKKINYSLKYEDRVIKLTMKNYIICSKNGLGYLFSTGGVAGIWAYVCQDPTIEAVQPKCQGRGDPECEVIAAPYDTLVKMGYKPLKCRELEKLELDEQYEQFNQIRPTQWASNSLKDLIDSGFFEYKHGQVTYRGERFFLCEASFMYILEKELKKLKGGLKTLWDVSFDFGKKLAQISGKQNPCKFIMDFFPALGFGDILATEEKGKYKIYANYFPWIKWAEEIDFTMFRGLLSGVISSFIGKNIKLKKIEKDISPGFLSLYISN